MIWGCVSLDGMGALVKVEDIINGSKKTNKQKNLIFQQDNNQKETSKSANK